MIRGGSLHGGMLSGPRMQLAFECFIKRAQTVVTALGSSDTIYAALNNSAPVPCDISPMSDLLIVSQPGQQETLTHVIHFEAGTDVQLRDVVTISNGPQSLAYLGQSFYVAEVLQPSESIAYIRCHARRGKEVS